MAINNIVNSLRKGMLGLGLVLAASCGGGAGDGATSAAGCKNDTDCKGNRICIDGECIEGSRTPPGKDAYTPLPDTYDNLDTSQNCTSHFEKVCSDGDLYWKDSCGNLENKLENCKYGCSNGKCNEPGSDDFQNQCQNGNLTYCDVDTNQTEMLNCQSEGFSHCDYVEIVGNSICFGDGKSGDNCPTEAWFAYGDPALIKSECDYTKVDVCNVPGPNLAEAYCTNFCQNDSDCSWGCCNLDIKINEETIKNGCGPCISTGCSNEEYTCNYGSCIPGDYMCDGENDCNNGEDEEGCCTDECDHINQKK
ncbi:LDL receptor domain-containing protein, partial [Candidatus Woesearchaeota archaeon]|nr:LDL receptor domain-containing protein [Candidatus Woesearchaeota archaeon]